mgnify:FL=1
MLPFTLFLLLLFTVVTLFAAREYEMEKRYFKQAEEFRNLEILTFLALRELKKYNWQEVDTSSGKMEYVDGVVIYQVTSVSDEEVAIDLTCSTNNGAQWQGVIYLNMDTGKIIRWENKYGTS